MGVCIIGVGIYTYNIYSCVTNTLDKVHKPLDRDHSKKRTEEVKVADSKPVPILLMGADERAGDQRHSDSLMVITLNPKNKSMKLLSIPRDTYTEVVGKGKKDKINHAYAFGGINMSVDTVGGVDVKNDLEFTQDGTHFAKGNIHLTGDETLKYTRMRKKDLRGDFGRQMRQRQVLQAVISKGASFSSLANYGDVLKAIEKNVKTNLTQDQMFDMQKNYKEAMQNKEGIQI
ncbi:hypothetical protein IE3_00301 [Bacillus cereus BAG3X2-1]|nr:hypothetical protein IE3_00301 [Bacillus cereus BAG3X2-1]